MAGMDWQSAWIINLIAVYITGQFTLWCQQSVQFAAISSKLTATEEEKKSLLAVKKGEKKVELDQRRVWGFMFKAFVTVTFFISYALYLCNGEKFDLKSGHDMTRQNAFLSINILYAIINLMDHALKSFYNTDPAVVYNWLPIFINIIQAILALLGMVFIVINYSKDHTDGYYGFIIFAWVLVFAWKVLVVGVHYGWGKINMAQS